MGPTLPLSWISTSSPAGPLFPVKYCSVHAVLYVMYLTSLISATASNITNCYYKCLYKELPCRGLLRRKTRINTHFFSAPKPHILWSASLNQTCQPYMWGMPEYIMAQVTEETGTVIAFSLQIFSLLSFLWKDPVWYIGYVATLKYLCLQV